MLIWDYVEETNVLLVSRTYNSKVYTIRQKVNSIKQFAFWLHHYMYLDIQSFQTAATLSALSSDSDCNT